MRLRMPCESARGIAELGLGALLRWQTSRGAAGEAARGIAKLSVVRLSESVTLRGACQTTAGVAILCGGATGGGDLCR